MRASSAAAVAALPLLLVMVITFLALVPAPVSALLYIQQDGVISGVPRKGALRAAWEVGG
jgi:hypothetical protein